jgi:hypothetical protein
MVVTENTSKGQYGKGKQCCKCQSWVLRIIEVFLFHANRYLRRFSIIAVFAEFVANLQMWHLPGDLAI